MTDTLPDPRDSEDGEPSDYEQGYEDASREWATGLCPYALGVGICSMGCYEEPACQTDRPTDGWPTDPLVAPLLALVPPKRYEIAHAVRTGRIVERWSFATGWSEWHPTGTDRRWLHLDEPPRFHSDGDDRMHGLRVAP